MTTQNNTRPIPRPASARHAPLRRAPFARALPHALLLVAAVALLALQALAEDAGAPSPGEAGVFVRHDESSEEILARAHLFDADAIALAAAGYSRGRWGFPKEPLLADAWASTLYDIGAEEAGDCIRFLLKQDREADGDDFIAPQLRAAYCKAVAETATARRFHQAGLFDLAALCPRPLGNAALPPGMDSAKKQAQAARASMRLMRELRARKATHAEAQSLENALPYPVLLFFAATSHDPETERPDWSNERLLDFMAAQDPYPPTAFSRGTSENGWTALETLLLGVNSLLSKRLSEDPARMLETIRLAHRGDMAAARAMAHQYRQGGFGFIRDASLAALWQYHAAARGDGVSQFLLAIEAFEQGRLAGAWSAAALASEYGDRAMQTLARDLIARIEAKSAYDRREAEKELSEFKKAMEQRRRWKIAAP